MPLLLGTLTLLTTAAVKDSSLALRGLSAGSSPTGTTPIQLSAAPSSGSASPTWRHGRVTAPQGSGAAGRVWAQGGEPGRREGGTQRGPLTPHPQPPPAVPTALLGPRTAPSHCRTLPTTSKSFRVATAPPLTPGPSAPPHTPSSHHPH